MSAWLAAISFLSTLVGTVTLKAAQLLQQMVVSFVDNVVLQPLTRWVGRRKQGCKSRFGCNGLDEKEEACIMSGGVSLPKCGRQDLPTLLLLPQTSPGKGAFSATPTCGTPRTPLWDGDSMTPIQRTDSIQEGESSKKFVIALHCDNNFNICQADDGILELLKFTRGNLIGKSILELMSPAVADVHQQIFKNLKHIAPESVCEVGKQLLMSTMSRCREFVVLDSNKEAVVCSVSVVLRKDLSSKVILQNTEGKLLNTVPLGFGRYINDKPDCHVRDFEDVMCVMMDVAGSTRFSQSKPASVMAELFHQMYVIANSVVLQEAFPFAYIHEIVGDSLLLLVNAGFMVRYPSRAAAIGSHVAMQIQRRLDVMLAAYSAEMYTRVGIAVGPVSAGVVDGRTFRIFGSTVHLSQRLESLCPRGKVACSMPFLDTLCRQIDEDINVDLVESEAKGFGKVKYATLQCGILGEKKHAKLIH